MSKNVVLFGGTNSERMVSCASAQHIVSILSDAECWFWGLDGTVSSVDRQNILNHENVFVSEFVPTRVLKKWNTVGEALDDAKNRNLTLYLGVHGGDGENGWLQAECEKRGVAFTGSGSVTSELAMNKPLAKERVRAHGIKVAEQYTFYAKDSEAKANLAGFQSKFGSIVLKPASDGSSVGLSFINSSEELTQWWRDNGSSTNQWLAEEFLRGREFTVGVMMFRNCLTVLPPSEVILDRNARFDYKGKYLGVGNREVTPAELTIAEQTAAQQLALLAYAALGCYGYTRGEMIMTDRGFYFLEINTLPGLTKKSFIPQQLTAAKVDMAEFFHHQIELANRRLNGL